LIISAIEVKAEISVKTYRERMASDNKALVELTKRYIRGLGEGMEWANGEATNRKTPLFCAPDMALGTENFIDILNQEIKRMSPLETAAELEETFIGLLLMDGLQRVFPCKHK
jgi:hypothetical protein